MGGFMICVPHQIFFCDQIT